MVLIDDMVEDILLRLGVRDLIRYKIVCKSWYSLISTHAFAIAHLNHQRTTSNNNNTDTTLGEHVRIAMPKYWKVPNENLFQNNTWRVVGSSNGLVCFTPLPIGPLILVINPWTRELRKLSMPQQMIPYDSLRMSLSFSYDSSTDDYKLVLGTNTRTTKEMLFQVLSLKSNTWKLIGLFKYRLFRITPEPGILFNGALHWLAGDYNSNETKRVILSFDLSREEFTVIPEPDDSIYKCCLIDGHVYLGIVEDKLCIFFCDKTSHLLCNDIWVMRSCKGERFWELLPDNYEMKYQAVHLMKVLECTSLKKNRMSFFCDDNKCLSKAWSHVYAPLFVPSLVSPYAGKPRHAKSKKTSIKSWCPKGIVGPHPTVRNCSFYGASEKTLRRIEAEYRQEYGESENFFFHEEGNKEIEESLTKIESGKEK